MSIINFIRYFIAKLFEKFQVPIIKKSNIHKSSRVTIGNTIIHTNIGRYSYVGKKTSIINTNVGNFTSIASNCIIGGGKHPTDWVTTSPLFYRGRNIFKQTFSSNYFNQYDKTNIGNDVWIGSNSLIRSGVVISDGAILGMGSVLTKNIGPYEIWAGNPAKLIRKRFPDEIVNKLIQLEWWSWDINEIKNKANYFNNIDEFIRMR
jgi:acetyltransferase-like isoleucine patch superfamily enzyme